MDKGASSKQISFITKMQETLNEDVYSEEQLESMTMQEASTAIRELKERVDNESKADDKKINYTLDLMEKLNIYPFEEYELNEMSNGDVDRLYRSLALIRDTTESPFTIVIERKDS